MIPELACKNFGKFRKGLIYFALKFKISFEDAEEIVNDSILKALNYYDPDRGSFEALCRVILKHRILNFKKKFKEIIIIGLLDDEDLFKEFYKNHKDIEELEYYNKQCIDILKELMLQLNKEENEFLNRVYEISGNGKKYPFPKLQKI